MNNRSLDKAFDIIAKLITGEAVSRNDKDTVALYEEYSSSAEIYDIVTTLLKKLNLGLYEYNYTLYVTPLDHNKVFGYSNEELKREIGVKYNRELYLCHFIIYNIIIKFYQDSDSYTYVDFAKIEDIINSVDSTLSNVTNKLSVLGVNEVEENSFKMIALIWEDMPIVSNGETATRAARNSKAGFVKIVLNFLIQQELLIETEGRYYPAERFKALIQNYFEEYKGRLYEIMRGAEANAAHE